MARHLRIDFPGAWHHVMHRGARRAPIFKQDEHCTMFLDALGEASQRAAIEVHAYSLMPNHFHLLVRSPRGTLSRAMKHLLGKYVQRVNTLRGWDGPMFRGRYKNQLVTGDEYLRALMAYIHLNPVRDHLVASPEDECWTSYRAHLGIEPAPPWLHGGAVQEWFGGAKGLRQWVRAVQTKRERMPDDMDATTGWIQRRGKEAEEVAPVKRAPARGPEAIGKKAGNDALLARLCEVTGVSRATLMRSWRGRDANPARRFAALALANREALSHSEVAQLLAMTVKGVSNVVYRAARRGSTEFPEWWEKWEATAPAREGAAQVKSAP